MERRTFTKTCIVCLGGTILAPLLSACQSTHYATGTIEPHGLSVLKTEFAYVKKDQPMVRQYIIVRNDALEFPIYVYRFNDTTYSAVLMKCSHQGAELQAAGDHLHCPSHGSEFNNKGVLAQGPAEKDLRSFTVLNHDDKIFIDLRS
jgi:nitrite reductase/ring-hydroxylating ferredoxin subunit